MKVLEFIVLQSEGLSNTNLPISEAIVSVF
ncbi:hypothetical protein SAMN05421807_11675 [Virgibacillus chiguensis]|uniref:Uncharacterized protein n=1 Tax=Virgibacillus chiguensis TaxID=411959 RepID=A0A1M5WHZ0_9BACI|nr:hypothetical protein SAMN05421807_11675 [Virgibacillus chiguensis]